jgi:hypothetical protein
VQSTRIQAIGLPAFPPSLAPCGSRGTCPPGIRHCLFISELLATLYPRLAQGYLPARQGSSCHQCNLQPQNI